MVGSSKTRLHQISGSPHDLKEEFLEIFLESRQQQPLGTSFSALVVGWGPRRHTLGRAGAAEGGVTKLPVAPAACVCRGVFCSGARTWLCHMASFRGYSCSGC